VTAQQGKTADPGLSQEAPASGIEPTIRVQEDDFDLADETRAITAGRRDIGAVVTFTGLCRDENASLSAIELEHYPAMAQKELRRIAAQALMRWPLSALTVIHRFGRIVPGDNIVLVIAAARHRRAAFEAADFIMDFLKTSAPFWKKDHRIDGRPVGWVEARKQDEQDRQRWQTDQQDRQA